MFSLSAEEMHSNPTRIYSSKESNNLHIHYLRLISLTLLPILVNAGGRSKYSAKRQILLYMLTGKILYLSW